MFILDYSDLIGIPFKNRGRSKDGLDCYGLVQQVYKKCGIELPEFYADFDDAEKIQSIIRQNTDSFSWKRLSEPVFPCVIAIRFGSKFINHTAVYIGGGKFLHTRDKIGVCVDRISNPAWRKVIVGFYQYVGGTHDNTCHCKESV